MLKLRKYISATTAFKISKNASFRATQFTIGELNDDLELYPDSDHDLDMVQECVKKFIENLLSVPYYKEACRSGHFVNSLNYKTEGNIPENDFCLISNIGLDEFEIFNDEFYGIKRYTESVSNELKTINIRQSIKKDRSSAPDSIRNPNFLLNSLLKEKLKKSPKAKVESQDMPVHFSSQIDTSYSRIFNEDVCLFIFRNGISNIIEKLIHRYVGCDDISLYLASKKTRLAKISLLKHC